MNNGIFSSSSITETERSRLSHKTSLMPRGMFVNTNILFDMPYHLPPGDDWKLSTSDFSLVYDTTKENTLLISISLSTITSGGIINIDWGDGITENFTTTGSKSHTYSKHGIYIVQIRGPVTSLGLDYNIKITKILNYGSKIDTFFDMHRFLANLIYVPPTIPIGISNFVRVFQGCSIFNHPNVTNWDTSNITNLTTAFGNASAFNQPLNWNTSNVTSFVQTFFYADAFNQDIGNFNVSQATSFSSMFAGTLNFNNGNSPNISGWNTSNVTSMRDMFNNARSFNQPLGTWNTSKVTDLGLMFQDAASFNQDIGSWDISKVTTLQQTFFRATNFNNGGSTSISGWNTSGVTRMDATFRQSSFNQPIQNWNTINVTSLSQTFTTTPFNQNLNNWNVRKVTSFANMLQQARSFNGSVSGWELGLDTAATDCNTMFSEANAFVGSGLSTWNTSKVTNMNSMFYNCTKLGSGINLNLSNWSVTGVTTMSNMFYGCSNLKNATISGWSTKAGCSHDSQFQVANLSGSYLPNWTISGGNYCYAMFNQATLTNVSGLDSWNTIGISNMQAMFATAAFNSGTSSISNWNVSNVTTMQQMFQTTAGFNQDLSSWNVSNCTNFRLMFYQNSSFNNSVSGWNFPSGTTLAEMFAGHLVAFTGNGLDSWNVTGVVNVNQAFSTNPNASAISTKITDWNLCNCTDMSNIFVSTTISTGNYDNLLNAWKVKTTGNGVKNWATNLTPHFGSSKYTAAGSGSRAALVSYGWTITDGGLQV